MSPRWQQAQDKWRSVHFPHLDYTSHWWVFTQCCHQPLSMTFSHHLFSLWANPGGPQVCGGKNATGNFNGEIDKSAWQIRLNSKGKIYWPGRTGPSFNSCLDKSGVWLGVLQLVWKIIKGLWGNHWTPCEGWAWQWRRCAQMLACSPDDLLYTSVFISHLIRYSSCGAL